MSHNGSISANLAETYFPCDIASAAIYLPPKCWKIREDLGFVNIILAVVRIFMKIISWHITIATVINVLCVLTSKGWLKIHNPYTNALTRSVELILGQVTIQVLETSSLHEHGTCHLFRQGALCLAITIHSVTIVLHNADTSRVLPDMNKFFWLNKLHEQLYVFSFDMFEMALIYHCVSNQGKNTNIYRFCSQPQNLILNKSIAKKHSTRKKARRNAEEDKKRRYSKKRTRDRKRETEDGWKGHKANKHVL